MAPAPASRSRSRPRRISLMDRSLSQAVMAEHAVAAEMHGNAIPSACRDLALDSLLLQVRHTSMITKALCMPACRHNLGAF